MQRTWCFPATKPEGSVTSMQTLISLKFKCYSLENGVVKQSASLKVLRPAISTQVFLGFPVSISKCSDGSQDSKLPLHASHVALPT